MKRQIMSVLNKWTVCFSFWVNGRKRTVGSILCLLIVVSFHFTKDSPVNTLDKQSDTFFVVQFWDMFCKYKTH